MPDYRFDLICKDDIACDTMMFILKEKYGKALVKPKSGDHYVNFYANFFIMIPCKDINEADMISREMLKKYRGTINRINICPQKI